MANELDQGAEPITPVEPNRRYFGRRAMVVLTVTMTATLLLALSSVALEQERQVNLVYFAAAIDELYSEKGPFDESAVLDHITILKEFRVSPESRTLLPVLGRFVQFVDFKMRVGPIIKILGEPGDPKLRIERARDELFGFYSEIRLRCSPQSWDELLPNPEFSKKAANSINVFSEFVDTLPTKIDPKQCVDACKKSRTNFMLAVRAYARTKIGDDDRLALDRFLKTERIVELRTRSLIESGTLSDLEEARITGYHDSMLRRIKIIELLRDKKMSDAISEIDLHLALERKNVPRYQDAESDQSE